MPRIKLVDVPPRLLKSPELNHWLKLGRAAFSVAIAGGLSGVSACHGCGSEKPYTPFGVASSLPPSAPLASSAPPPQSLASAGFALRRAELAPGAASAWQGAGLELSAPDARRFAQVLTGDFDGDQKLDALAWLLPSPNQKNAAPGELWYFPNGAPARKLCALPSFVPTGPDCTLNPTLTQTGARSATLDVSASCNAPLIARSPARAIVVVSPSVKEPVLLTLRAAEAAPNETLNFSVDSSDQDQDGRDDVRLTLNVGALGTSEPASADVAWLDRAAGASRSASEPAQSLLRLTARLGARARSKRGSYRPESADNALRLLSSLCGESGAGRVFDEDGAPLPCGDLTRVVDALANAELRYAVAQGDVLEGFALLRRDGWYFRPMSIAQRKQVQRELLRLVTKLDLDAPYVARAEPTLPQLPHYSPLRFEADGALLIQGPNGVTRVPPNPSPDGNGEGAPTVDGGDQSWPVELAAQNGQRITGASHACDRSELLFNRSDAQRGLLPPLSSRLLAARPASCSGRGTGPAVSIAPLAFDASGFEALVEGSYITTAASGQNGYASPKPRAHSATPAAVGTPRSADGHWLITPTSLGLLLVGDRKELWQTSALPEHADASKFSDCVVANDARAAACIEAGHALIFERPKRGPAPPHE